MLTSKRNNIFKLKLITMETNDNNKEEKNKITGVLFTGCMFVGMGVGFLTGHLLPGMFIGMGVGFLASAAYRMRNN